MKDLAEELVLAGGEPEDEPQIQYTHQRYSLVPFGPNPSNFHRARTRAQIEATATGHSARDEGLTHREPLETYNDQLPWR